MPRSVGVILRSDNPLKPPAGWKALGKRALNVEEGHVLGLEEASGAGFTLLRRIWCDKSQSI